MRRLRIILATPFLLLGVLIKSIGIFILPAHTREEAKKLF